MKTQRRPETVLLPVPAVMVSIGDGEGPPNIVTLAWTGTVCSAPPMLSIAVRPSRHSYGLLQRTHDFVVNIPRAAQLWELDHCGSVSGSDVDKFAACGFTAVPASRVGSPMIEECPINIECAVRQVIELGLHTMFIGEIVGMVADSEVLSPRQLPDIEKVRPMLFGSFGSMAYYGIGAKLGAAFSVGNQLQRS